MEYLVIVLSLVLGGVIGWIFGKNRSQNNVDISINNEELIQVQGKLQLADELKLRVEEELEDAKLKLEEERRISLEINKKLTQKETEYQNLEEKLSEQKLELNKINERFSLEFKNLANEIFEEKSKKFTDQNKTNLSELLLPLKERIGDFQKKIEDTNKESLERNASLVQHIKNLSDLNKQITKEAENLTKALKGDNKAQGNWGEVILERILEKSGLQKDREYFTQVSEVSEEGKRYQPDVVVKLPEEKSIIIDSKVSLISYERYVNAESEEEQAQNLKLHINSIRAHIKSLGDKNYQNLYDLKGLDFVLLFIPIEPAFTLAMQYDNELFNDAYAKNIVVVSPSTLIATLRTISSIWKQEYQNKNVMEIARQSGALYDKFVGFVDDLKNIGRHIESSQKVYRDSMKKLYEGSGNLVRRAENIKKLGAKTSKQLDQQLLDRSEE
jgi:DNA recombination protein RmuC